MKYISSSFTIVGFLMSFKMAEQFSMFYVKISLNHYILVPANCYYLFKLKQITNSYQLRSTIFQELGIYFL